MYVADVLNQPNCFPFGMMLPNRNDQGTGEYRYGYQGSEKDDEIKGEGNSYTTYFRQLDPRVGRWLSIDPVMNAVESSYVSMGNNPLNNTDRLGNTIDPVNKEGKEKVDNSIKESLSDTKLVNLFLNSYNQETGKYENILRTDFLEATSGLSDDEKAAANGLYQQINSASTLYVLIMHDKKLVKEEDGFLSIPGELTSMVEDHDNGKSLLIDESNSKADGRETYFDDSALGGKPDKDGNSVLFFNYQRSEKRKVIESEPGYFMGKNASANAEIAFMSRIIGTLWRTGDAYIQNGGDPGNPNSSKPKLSRVEVQNISTQLKYKQIENMIRRVNNLNELSGSKKSQGIPKELEIWVIQGPYTYTPETFPVKW